MGEVIGHLEVIELDPNDPLRKVIAETRELLQNAVDNIHRKGEDPFTETFSCLSGNDLRPPASDEAYHEVLERLSDENIQHMREQAEESAAWDEIYRLDREYIEGEIGIMTEEQWQLFRTDFSRRTNLFHFAQLALQRSERRDRQAYRLRRNKHRGRLKNQIPWRKLARGLQFAA